MNDLLMPYEDKGPDISEFCKDAQIDKIRLRIRLQDEKSNPPLTCDVHCVYIDETHTCYCPTIGQYRGSSYAARECNSNGGILAVMYIRFSKGWIPTFLTKLVEGLSIFCHRPPEDSRQEQDTIINMHVSEQSYASTVEYNNTRTTDYPECSEMWPPSQRHAKWGDEFHQNDFGETITYSKWELFLDHNSELI
jgi:hypothetical protein